MASDQGNNSDEHQHEEHGRVAEFFHHNAVVFFFGCIFLVMMIFGLVYSGGVDVPAGASEGFVEVPINALLVFLAFGGALAFTFLWPRWIGVYFLIVVVLAMFFIRPTFEFATDPVNAETQAPGNQAPAPFLTFVYLLMTVYGTFFMFGGTLKEALFGKADEEE